MGSYDLSSLCKTLVFQIYTQTCVFEIYIQKFPYLYHKSTCRHLYFNVLTIIVFSICIQTLVFSMCIRAICNTRSCRAFCLHEGHGNRNDSHSKPRAFKNRYSYRSNYADYTESSFIFSIHAKTRFTYSRFKDRIHG